MTSPTDAPGRRELNRRATELAIVEATTSLAEQDAWDAVTVERIAQEAQISRRTFFNYFPTRQDALLHPLRQLAADVSAALVERAQPGPDIIAELLDTLDVVLTAERLRYPARTLLLSRGRADLRQDVLLAWEDLTRDVSTQACQNGVFEDTFFATVLARSAVGAAQAAFDHWVAALPDDAESLTERDVASLREDVTQALTFLRNGFHQSPPPAVGHREPSAGPSDRPAAHHASSDLNA